MKPDFSLRNLARTKVSEYLVRFVFGGAIALGAFVIGKTYGPRVGGLFLAFPALLPAGLTLLEEHDGRRAARDDARGAILGSLGLMAFALIVRYVAPRGGAWALSLALVGWLIVSVGAWLVVYGRRPS